MSGFSKKIDKTLKFPLIIFDDLHSNIGYVLDMASNVSPETVNFMIKKAKGLTYVCITEEKSNQLGIPFMIGKPSGENKKDFTVSVDYKTTTTGISAFERAETIRAFVNKEVGEQDFKRPGHLFPLICVKNGLLEREGIAEAAIWLSQVTEHEMAAYATEILNTQGEISNWTEIQAFSQEYGIEILTMSQIVRMCHNQTKWLELKTENSLQNYPHVSVYEIENKLTSTSFSLYYNPSRQGKGEIVLYNECVNGDLLGQQHCGCDFHFKDYFNQLIKGRIQAILYQRDAYFEMAEKSEKELVEGQLQDFIDKLMAVDLYRISI